MNIDYLPRKASGLYIMSKKDFDPLAYRLLLERQPEVLNRAMPLDVDALAEDGLYLECRDELLSREGTILGFITFADIKIPVYNDDMEEMMIETATGTIVIDKRLRERMTRYRFTKAHEIAHWILHRSFCSPGNKPYNFRKSGDSYIACRQESVGRKNPVEAKTDKDWSEWQSDCFAAALLMPACTFIPTADEIIRAHGFTDGKLIGNVNDSQTRKVVAEIASVYNVSVRSAGIRLSTYGFCD